MLRGIGRVMYSKFYTEFKVKWSHKFDNLLSSLKWPFLDWKTIHKMQNKGETFDRRKREKKLEELKRQASQNMSQCHKHILE